jgi:hypothetical protein
VTEGVLTASSGRAVWAWVAVQMDAAADLTEAQEYADVPELERRRKAVAAETTWLAGQWETEHSTHIELRYRTEPGIRRLTCAVLGRVVAGNPQDAELAALRLRARLSDMPRHVRATEVTDTAEVAQLLHPFTPEPSGLAEIRKRIRAAPPNRPDAGVRYYTAVQPFTAAAPPWEPLWQAMVAQPHPVMLSVGLEPYRVGADVSSWLSEVATQYGRLAIPGETPEGIYSGRSKLAPDAFATDASRVYTDAARRYSGRTFRVRIMLASPAPISDALAELAAATISPPERAGDDAVLTTTFHGPAHVVVRPTAAEIEAARGNLATLDFTHWDTEYVAELPEHPSSGIRLLAELVDPREASAAMRLPLAIHGYMPGFPVLRPDPPLEIFYRPMGPHVTLGRQLVAGRQSAPLGIALPDLTRHALFAGTTGSGKTNSTLALCEQLWRDHHVPFLVIEPVNSALDDYRWLATRPGFEDLLVLTVGNEDVAPLRLNPFEVPPGVRISSHIAGLLACFDAAFGLWDPLPIIYNRALRATYARRGFVSTDLARPEHRGTWPTLTDFVKEIRAQTERLDYSGEVRSNIIAASQLRAESLAEGACASTLDCQISYPMAALLGRPVVLELAEVGDNAKEQSLMMALILQTMTEYYKANRPESGSLMHVTVIEEAHRLLGRPVAQNADAREGDAQARAAQAFADTLAQNRKYGEALVIVEQVPGKLVEDAYKNTNLKIMHRLPAEEDREVLGSAMTFSAEQQRYAAGLPPFTAFAHYDGLDRPALVRVPNVREDAAKEAGQPRAPLADDTALSQRFLTAAGTSPEIDVALAPFPECEGCRHRCAFRARAAAAVQPEHAAELKRRMKAFPKTASAQRTWWYDLISWVSSIANRLPLPPVTEGHGVNESARSDFESCILVHIARNSFRAGGVLPWVKRFRTVRSKPIETSKYVATGEARP